MYVYISRISANTDGKQFGSHGQCGYCRRYDMTVILKFLSEIFIVTTVCMYVCMYVGLSNVATGASLSTLSDILLVVGQVDRDKIVRLNSVPLGLSAGMYLCMYVCMYICMYLYVCVFVDNLFSHCVLICMYVCMYVIEKAPRQRTELVNVSSVALTYDVDLSTIHHLNSR